MGGEDVDLYQSRAQIHVKLGQFDKAVDDAFTARNLDREDFNATLFLGKVLFENQQFSLSLVYLNIASNLTKDEEDAQNAKLDKMTEDYNKHMDYLKKKAMEKKKD